MQTLKLWGLGPEKRHSSADLLRGIELNPNLTEVYLDWLDSDRGAESKAKAFYIDRNKVSAELNNASPAKMLTTIESIDKGERKFQYDYRLSLVYEILRTHDDWR